MDMYIQMPASDILRWKGSMHRILKIGNSYWERLAYLAVHDSGWMLSPDTGLKLDRGTRAWVTRWMQWILSSWPCYWRLFVPVFVLLSLPWPPESLAGPSASDSNFAGTTRSHLTWFLTMSSSLGGGADSCLLPQHGCSRCRAGTWETRCCCRPHGVRNCLAGLDPGFCHCLFLIALPFLPQPWRPCPQPLGTLEAWSVLTVASTALHLVSNGSAHLVLKFLLKQTF